MMKKHLPHRAIPEPTDLSVDAWRYMPLSQLLAILVTGKLPLIRVDLLGDPFEGSVTDDVKAYDAAMATEAVKVLYGDARFVPRTGMSVEEQIAHRRISVLKSSHASCWRMGKESEGMWRLYCGEKDGVALRTTCEKLKESITDDATRLGQITYIDYAKGGMPADNYLYPLMYKRDGFADEREVRLIRFLEHDCAKVYNHPTLEGGPPAMMMTWGIEEAAEEVIVSPYAGKWYFDAVRKTLAKLAPTIATRVSWSNLRGLPRH